MGKTFIRRGLGGNLADKYDELKLDFISLLNNDILHQIKKKKLL